IPSPGDNTVTVNVDTTTISTKAYVDTEIANLIGGAPATLDTLKELAEALSDDTDAFNTLFNRTRIDSDGSRGLKRDGTGTSTKLYVDTDVIADTEWVKARIAAEDHIDTKYTSGYGLNLVDSEFSVNTGKFLDTDALENYVKESFTEVGYIVVDGGLNIQLSRDLTGGSDRQELAYTAGNGLKLASDANRTLTVDTDIIADTEWVKARIAAEDHIDTKYTAGTGLNLVDSEFSVNTSVIATQTYVNTHAGVIKDTEVSSGTGITVLQVDSEGTSHTEINIDTETYFPVTNSSINTLFGRRIKTFNLSTGTIEFEEFAYVYSNVTDTYTPSSVRWDQPATQTRIRYNNNDNFQSEFVNTLANWSTFHSATPSNLTTLTIPAVNNTYVSTFDVSATFSGDNGKDQDVQSTWATNGQGGGIGTQYQLRTNNGSVSAGQTTALNWPNVSASNSWPGKTPIRFDSIQTTLPLRVSYNTATSANNINLTALRMTVGGIGTDLDTDANITKSTSQINTTASGVTIYYDTSVDITASVDFTRPETVMEGTLAQRTYGYSSTLPNQVAGARYPHWRILNSTNVGQVFDVTELGALSNSGYATSAVSTSTSKTSWRNSTYTASSGATGQTMHLVVPSAPVAGFRDPLNQSLTFTPNNGDAGTQVTLGHTDHTETYFVYSFNVPANASLTVQPF
ncbi:MAG: hypothetical protein K0U78_05790, partial [Actinomycetia bacterium]|nr:hypothetical protein [Actinomycetes bacterium]